MTSRVAMEKVDGRATAEAVLELRDLRVSYATGSGQLPAVRGIDLVIRAGETVGLAGESGCGKSTVASAVLRLLPRDATVTGHVLLGGEDVTTMSWGRLRAVRWSGASIVFQGALHSLNPVHRVGDQVAEPLLLHDPAGPRPPRAASEPRVRDRVVALLDQVGLPAWRADSYPHELSGGQKQRVMIAMALACEPQLVITDEATTALDVMVQAQVLKVLEVLAEDHGLAVLMISHDLSVLSSSCDRVVVMYGGRIVESADAATLFAMPAHPYSVALAAAFPVVGDMAARRAPSGLDGDPPDPTDLPPGCVFAPRCSWRVAHCTEDPPLEPVADASLLRSAACWRAEEVLHGPTEG